MVRMKRKAYWNHKRKRGRPKVAISSVIAKVYQFLPKDGSKIGATELRELARKSGLSFTTLYKNLNQLVELRLAHKDYDLSKYPPLVYYARTAPYLMGPRWQFPELAGKIKELEKIAREEDKALRQIITFCELLKRNYNRIEDREFKDKARKALASVLEGAIAEMAKSYFSMVRISLTAKDEQRRELYIKMFKELVLSAYDQLILRLASGMPSEVFDELLSPEDALKNEILDLDPKLYEELVSILKRHAPPSRGEKEKGGEKA